jgi:hypothetical protein
LKFVILILSIFIILSGCVEESKVNRLSEPFNQSTELVNQSADTMKKNSANLSSTALSRKENIPEIEVTSFSSIYMHDNSETGYNIIERYYAVYGLSIKNNGSKNLDFKLNKLKVHDGSIVNATIEPEYQLSSNLEILSDLKKETKIEDTTLFPEQTISGSVVFQVNLLYNKSFLLMYNETPVPSNSFEKGIEALKTAEDYNYSVIFGIPPYNNINHDSFEPNLKEGPYIWANCVNRSIFEIYNKAAFEAVAKSQRGNTPPTTIVYALKVIPERNITSILTRNIKSNPENKLIVFDHTGEELINTSISTTIDKIAILKNQTYELHSGENMDIPEMNLSNATIVKISFMNDYNGCISLINQDVILDKELNMTAVRKSRLYMQ